MFFNFPFSDDNGDQAINDNCDSVPHLSFSPHEPQIALTVKMERLYESSAAMIIMRLDTHSQLFGFFQMESCNRTGPQSCAHRGLLLQQLANYAWRYAILFSHVTVVWPGCKGSIPNQWPAKRSHNTLK